MAGAEKVPQTRRELDPALLKEVFGTKPDLTTRYPDGMIDRLANTLKDAEDAA